MSNQVFKKNLFLITIFKIFFISSSGLNKPPSELIILILSEGALKSFKGSKIFSVDPFLVGLLKLNIHFFVLC